ncbi:hypothetical protein SUGI_0949950 [Cryptomeria japonica]|nr:hypothetical protein SUGI_0949950 [Cryptomeria japonica]
MIYFVAFVYNVTTGRNSMEVGKLDKNSDVADQTFVLVHKHGCPTKYRAEVQVVGHECDLALLTVSNEEFWEGMNFLKFGTFLVC